jgi:hypothetical protein
MVAAKAHQGPQRQTADQFLIATSRRQWQQINQPFHQGTVRRKCGLEKCPAPARGNGMQVEFKVVRHRPFRIEQLGQGQLQA